jgi:CRP-like cAMP-binding protein
MNRPEPKVPAQAVETPKPDAAAILEPAEALANSLYQLIDAQPFFKGFTAAQLELLAASALEMKFEAGQTIFAAGSPANRFYLILEGQVVLETEVAEHNQMAVQTLWPGDDLGWSWLFPPYSLHFSARAIEPTRTIFFYGTRLREQCEADHELGYQMMRRIAEVASRRLQAMQSSLLQSKDPEKLDQ